MKHNGFWWNVEVLDDSWKEGVTGLNKDAVFSGLREYLMAF